MENQPTDEQPRTLDQQSSPAKVSAALQDRPTASQSLIQNKKRRRFKLLHIALVLLSLVLLTGGGLLAFGYYYYNTNVHSSLSQFIRPVSRDQNEPVLDTTPTSNVIQGHSWNILLMGSDNDGKYTYPAVLTQVMMVVHINPATSSVSIVSIPRDSWVPVPEIGGMHKIDQAFLLGVNQSSQFEDGVRLARLTIEQDYGIPIDRYAWVGLNGFAKVIDTLGGIDIDIAHPIVDDTYPDDTDQGTNDPYAFTRLSLTPGPQHLNGTQALEYVRSRHADLVGDIGRTQRQQQVLEALKLKLNVGSILNHLPTLLKDLTGQVYTDLSEQEMIAFANFGRTLTNNELQHLTLGPGQDDQAFGNSMSVYDPSLGTNQDVILPDCNTIEPAVNRIFELGDVSSCHITR